MKRIIAMIITVMIAMSAVGLTAFAADQTTAKSGMITIDSMDVKAGKDFSVAVNMTVNPGIFGMTVEIVFDKNAITYKNATQDGKVFDKDGEIIVNDSYKTDGKIIISPLINGYDKNCSKTGKLLTLNFKANDNAKNGSYSITPNVFQDGKNDGSAFNIDGAMVPFKFTSGVVTISGGAKADATSDNDSATTDNGSADNNSDNSAKTAETNAENDDLNSSQTGSGVEIGGTAKNEANSQGSAIPWIIVGVLVVVVAAVAVMIVVKKKKNPDSKNDESDKTDKQ